MKIIDKIIWDGKNTEDVVRFCCKYDYDLCEIYKEFDNLITKERNLSIEPKDIMRHYDFLVPLNGTVVTDGKRLKILKETKS